MKAVPFLAFGLILFATSAAAQAECYADYKAKQGDPPQFAYGVSQIADSACGDKRAAADELAPRLAAGGWTLLKIVSSFGPEGLDKRKANAGDLFLRY